MRPIVSSIGSPTETLAKWLLQELKTITPSPGLDIKNSIKFTEKLREFEIEEDELLVSFDVTSLYPSISIDIAMKNMEDGLVSARMDMHKVSRQTENRLTLKNSLQQTVSIQYNINTPLSTV
jgi:hypothetical protein